MTKRYCSAPWHGLHINPRGDVKTCCAGNADMLGNINTYTVDEILNGDKMRSIREYMQEGKLHPEYCQNCLNGSNEIDWHNNINKNFDYESAPNSYLYPTIVDARWNITCNQSCNYCGPSSSSGWVAITGSTYKPETRKHTDSLFRMLEDNKHRVKEVALVGGEPLLLKENLAVLDMLKGTNCKIVVITSLNVDLENNKVFQKLKQHKNVGWSLSFDNIGKRFDYVRYGGNWEIHKKNVDTIIKLINDPNLNHSGGIHAVYSLYNCTRLVELKEWAASKGLSIFWQRLMFERDLDVYTQNTAVKELAIAEIEKMFKVCEVTEFEQQYFCDVLENLQRHTPKSNPLAFTQRIETQYHPDTKGQFEKLWPEIYQALGPI